MAYIILGWDPPGSSEIHHPLSLLLSEQSFIYGSDVFYGVVGCGGKVVPTERDG